MSQIKWKEIDKEFQKQVEHYKWKEMQYHALNDFLKQPGESFHINKIHPFDVAYMLNHSQGYVQMQTLDVQLLLLNGRMYIQTVVVEPKHKDIS